MGSKVTGEEELVFRVGMPGCTPPPRLLTFTSGPDLSSRPVAQHSFREAGVPWARVPGEAAFASVSVQMAGERSSRPPPPPAPPSVAGTGCTGERYF